LTAVPLLRLSLTPVFSFRPSPPTSTYPLSLHDALPISPRLFQRSPGPHQRRRADLLHDQGDHEPARSLARARELLGHRRRPLRGDRKSTRLNSSHEWISYAVFCLKKKHKTTYAYS